MKKSINLLKIQQLKHSHRYSLDSIILADHVKLKPNNRIMDLGCGCGIISMLLASQNPTIFVTGIDIQQSLTQLAIENVKNNKLDNQIAIRCQDLRTIKGNDFDKFDLIVCNPPFRKKNSGRKNNCYETLIAREEICCTIDDILIVSKKLLIFEGELNLIYPGERMAEIISKMNHYNIEPKELIPIYTQNNQPAKWIIIKGRLGAKPGIIVHPPVFTDNSECGQGNLS